MAIASNADSTPLGNPGEKVRYYGNVLHASQVADRLPLTFTPIDSGVLPALNHLTKRRIQRVRRASITAPFEQDTFVKSDGIKWIESRVYKTGESLTAGAMDDDWLYVQEVVKFVNEVRCFVLGRNIVTSSYYRIDGEFKPVWCGTNAFPFLQWMTDEATRFNAFPEGVVLDYGQLESGEWALIEANEAWASGLYYCDPELAFNVIEASQTD